MNHSQPETALVRPWKTTEKRRAAHAPYANGSLKPTCQDSVMKFCARQIENAIKITGISNLTGVSVHLPPKANTIALTATSTLLTGKLLDIIPRIPRIDGMMTQAYHTGHSAATSEEECRS